MRYRKIHLLVLLILISEFAVAQNQDVLNAPKSIKNPFLAGYVLTQPEPWFGISRAQLYPTSIIGPDEQGEGLVIDLKDSTLNGRIYSGVFYFEYRNSDYIYPRYRQISRLKHGRGVIEIKDFVEPASNSNVNRWTDEGVVAYRLELWKHDPEDMTYYGFHDSAVRFLYHDQQFKKGLTITEGPIVNLITSDHPDWIVISLETDIPSEAWIQVSGLGQFTDNKKSIRHEIKVQGLLPHTSYSYRVLCANETDTLRTPEFSFHSAPKSGSSPVIFAYTGDSRAGIGGGERQYLGVNRMILSQIGAAVFRKGAKFLLFGGDMVNGYTDHREDFILQFKAFKQSLFGFLTQRPLYTAVGNHEALLHTFRKEDGKDKFRMDKWPYQTESVEAVFANEFVHPENGPDPYPGTPPYRETVYSFTYGNVKFIVINNNYWWTYHNKISEFGGVPEGYILPNQMEWIRQKVNEGDQNPNISYIILMAQEPVFPNGGHVGDAMWNYGNNKRRAYMANDGQNVKPFSKGLIEVRNELWTIVSSSLKVAAVMGADEHAYHRTLISSKTPVGIYPEDDTNGDGRLNDAQFSPNPEFSHPTWYIVGGGGGAPYYVQENTPWSKWVQTFTSHYSYLIFKASHDKIKLEVYSLTGQLLDQVDDLMKIKQKDN